jgi:transposase
MALPTWAEKYKEKGKTIKKIKNNYYLYQIQVIWNKEKKKSEKKTIAYLGRITEGGLVKKSDNALMSERAQYISVKEFGASNWICQELQHEISLLKLHFANYWKEILCTVVFRLLYQSPFKQMEWHYEASFMSETYPGAKLSGKQISAWIKEVGTQRVEMVALLKKLFVGEEILLIDSTHIVSQASKNLNAQLGYNSQGVYEPQINLLFLFSQDKQMPLFYRAVSGSVRELRSMKLTLEESGIKSALIVGDKGFYSKENVECLESESWQYILPLRRNSSFIDYSATKQGGKENFDGYFIFEGRAIWFKTNNIEPKRRIVLFFDEKLKYSEAQDYLIRIAEKVAGYTIEKFHERQFKYGTLAVMTNTPELNEESIYQYFKSRNEIEVLYDTYKNVLEADRTYTHNALSMETWHFINFLAVRVYYKLYNYLRASDMLKKYAPMDCLLLMQLHRKLKINEEWLDGEIPKKSSNIFKICKPMA